MLRKLRVTAIAGLIAALAVLAFAGSFCTNNEPPCHTGNVSPANGYANETIFTYTIGYALSPGQDPPDVYVHITKGGVQQGSYMMSIEHIGSIIVDYRYQTTLSLAGTDWGFWFSTVDDTTPAYAGPIVE